MTSPTEDEPEECRGPGESASSGGAGGRSAPERRWDRFQPGVKLDTMPDLPDARYAGFLFNKTVIAYELMRAQWRRRLGLNTHERLAIEFLWDEGTLTMGEIGSRLALSRAAMTALVDRLEAAGYVDRRCDPLDRRRTLITLRQDIAKERIFPMAIGFGKSISEFARTLSREEWDAVVRFLDTVSKESRASAAQWSGLGDQELARVLDEQMRTLTADAAAAAAAVAEDETD